jgi:hypothetical protein
MQTELVQTPEMQSEALLQATLAPHGLQLGPPQSMPISAPSFFKLRQDATCNNT